jgi:hypothetical protein
MLQAGSVLLWSAIGASRPTAFGSESAFAEFLFDQLHPKDGDAVWTAPRQCARGGDAQLGVARSLGLVLVHEARLSLNEPSG